MGASGRRVFTRMVFEWEKCRFAGGRVISRGVELRFLTTRLPTRDVGTG